MQHQEHDHYYVPGPSYWPIVGSFGLISTVVGVVNILHDDPYGWSLFGLGLFIIFSMMVGWFGQVIRESLKGLYNKQVDRSYRWGMAWFIFSEVMFFAAFFGALFYVHEFSVPWLAGEGAKTSTGPVLWPQFKAVWPLLSNPNPSIFPGPEAAMEPWGIPAINTLLLLSSGVTLTISHWALKVGKIKKTAAFLFLTILLGVVFLCFQAYEYYHAYHEMGLTLNSGIYGSTFFMLTGFHGFHVTMGATMLSVILYRTMKNHFTKEHHFAFEAVAWYWHFVDVVWLFLFVTVYWL